jgi:hypothetical protein
MFDELQNLYEYLTILMLTVLDGSKVQITDLTYHSYQKFESTFKTAPLFEIP